MPNSKDVCVAPAGRLGFNSRQGHRARMQTGPLSLLARDIAAGVLS
jgi:hypothetical protein